MYSKYHCTNENCSYPGVTQFEMTFKSETIADANNVAVLFCPFCKKEMSPINETSVFCDPKINPQCEALK